jgi:hypothetical protein
MTGMRKKRFAIPLIFCFYFFGLVLVSTLPHLLDMTKTGISDPELVAGAISENLVSGFLLSIIILPTLIGIWLFIRNKKLSG